MRRVCWSRCFRRAGFVHGEPGNLSPDPSASHVGFDRWIRREHSRAYECLRRSKPWHRGGLFRKEFKDKRVQGFWGRVAFRLLPISPLAADLFVRSRLHPDFASNPRVWLTRGDRRMVVNWFDLDSLVFFFFFCGVMLRNTKCLNDLFHFFLEQHVLNVRFQISPYLFEFFGLV